jgi:cytochrome c-type biogenesis protein
LSNSRLAVSLPVCWIHIAAGAALFLAYAAGMGLTVAVAALAVGVAHGSLITRLRRAAPLVSRLDGLLLAAGGYVAYYGWWETRVLAGASTTDPVIDTGAAVQRWLAATLERAGPAMIAAIVAVLAAAGLAVAWATARRGRSGVDR